MRIFQIGQKVELSPLGRERIERRLGKIRRRGVIVGLPRQYQDSYNIKWETRKSIDMLHGDFVMAADNVEHAPQDNIVYLRELDSGTDNACWVACNRVDSDAIAFMPRAQIDTNMVSRALRGFDTGVGDPNDYRKRMHAALEAALNVPTTETSK